MSKSQHTRLAFTLVEILIVVVILAILATVAIPKFSNASQVARESTMKDDLRFLRNQIAVYRAQHNDVSPGYVGGNTSTTPTHEIFVAQLTETTNIFGVIGGTGTKFGPYLTRMPENPINGKVTVKMITGNDALASDDNYGWLFNPTTSVIRAANSGADNEGKPYLDY